MITALYASLLAFLVIFLALRVSKYRLKYKVGIGAGEHQALDVAIRCHANAIEIIPIAVLMLLLAELQGLHPLALHIAGIVLFVCRILHPLALTKAKGGAAFGRYYGTLGTWLSILLLALANIVMFVMQII